MFNMESTTLDTSKGKVHFEGPVTADYLGQLVMNENMSHFRPPEKQIEALKTITGLPHGMIFIARYENEIIAYVTFHYPDNYSRWSKHPRVLEMGGIEVSPDWRGERIGGVLMKHSFSHKILDQFIVITLEFCWHWDLKGTNLSIWGYQDMLSRLFGKVGLVLVTTDDPDITEHPANVMMGKIGEKVGKQDRLLFESMRFQKKYSQAMNIS